MPNTTTPQFISRDKQSLTAESFRSELFFDGYLDGRLEYIRQDAISHLKSRIEKKLSPKPRSFFSKIFGGSPVTTIPFIIAPLPPTEQINHSSWLHIWELTGPATDSDYAFGQCTLVTFSPELGGDIIEQLGSAVNAIDWQSSAKNFNY